MQLAFIILCLVSLSFIVMAVIILMGKGDSLIAGYNIASRQSRNVYRQKRLRIIVGVLLILVALALPTFGILLALGYKELVATVFPATAFVLFTGTLTAAHFWAKK